MKMDKAQIEDERRNGRIAGIIGVVGVILFTVGFIVEVRSDSQTTNDLAESLQVFSGESSKILVLRLMQVVGMLLVIPPLVTMFGAVRNRSEKLRPGLIGLCIAGPLFFGVSLLVSYIALEGASDAFDPSLIEAGEDPDDAAEDVYLDQGAASIGSGLAFAGALGLIFMMLYLSLNAMRIGLLTRFWGTLCMALGVAVLLFGPLTLSVYFLAISLMVAGFWPGGLPPAWAAGTALPWPKPGEGPPPGTDEGDELANPEDFEGTATEVDEESVRPGRRDNKRKRKRKAR